MDSSVRLELLDGELSLAIVKVITVTQALSLKSCHKRVDVAGVRIVLSQTQLMKCHYV